MYSATSAIPLTKQHIFTLFNHPLCIWFALPPRQYKRFFPSYKSITNQTPRISHYTLNKIKKSLRHWVAHITGHHTHLITPNKPTRDPPFQPPTFAAPERRVYGVFARVRYFLFLNNHTYLSKPHPTKAPISVTQRVHVEYAFSSSTGPALFAIKYVKAV